MKEALWLWSSAGSRVRDTGADDLFLLLGTENHDLNRRPCHHLVTALLKDDPAYRDRKLADGHTTAQHAAAHTSFFREWPRRRAAAGLWVEIGSNTYQKYSWPALFNLHDLSPDPVIRHRFGLLLDLAFIEEAQISVQGRRGGGRSRADGGALGFGAYKNLLHAIDGRPADCSHSPVIETSRYQLPAEAILLASRALPAPQPFVIRNRVPGQSEPPRPEDTDGQRIAADSALVNYAYRTPHYQLGTTLQNPALEYSGISRQNRAWDMLFEDARGGAIHPVIEKTRGGRPQHPFWSVQHESALVLQRIPTHPAGSYSTGKISIRFAADALTMVEEDGWIFASNGKAFAGVRFLDGGHQWNQQKTEAAPARFSGPGDSSRILVQAGDISCHGSFGQFRATVRSNPLTVTADKVDYRFGDGANHIEMTLYNPPSPASFTLPRINGQPIDLHPAAVYESPFLNGPFGGDRFTVSVGPIRRVLDFSGTGN